MSGAIELRAYVVGGHLPVAIVDALIAHGEPMLTDTPEDVFRYRAWIRLRAGGRTFGAPAPTVRLAAENLLAKVEGGAVRRTVAVPFVPLCMTAGEWADWQRLNPIRSNGFNAMRDHEAADSPCRDCPLGFAAEMRAVSRCNGQPGAVEEDEEMGTFDYRAAPELDSSTLTLPTPKAVPPTSRRVSLEVAPPTCESCAHEPVCALRAALEGMADVETTAPALPAGLSFTLTAVVACGHYLRDKSKPAPVRVLTPEQRGQANSVGIAGRAPREISDATRQKMRDSAIAARARKAEGATA